MRVALVLFMHGFWQATMYFGYFHEINWALNFSYFLFILHMIAASVAFFREVWIPMVPVQTAFLIASYSVATLQLVLVGQIVMALLTLLMAVTIFSRQSIYRKTGKLTWQ